MIKEQAEFRPQFYKVQAVVSEGIRISRHGISKTNGGRIAGESVCWIHWRDKEIYHEEAYMKEQYPNCEIKIVWKIK